MTGKGHAHGSEECRALFERLSEFLDGDLDGELRSGIESHMAGCAPCESFLDSLRRTVRWVESSPRQELPEDLRAWILRSPPGREG